MKTAFRARTVIPCAESGPARGLAALDAPLPELDDAVLLTGNGRIEAVESYKCFRRRAVSAYVFTDLGETRLVPGLVNAHSHLELSYLHGRTPGGGGFAHWMRGLVSLLGLPVEEDRLVEALRQALGSALQGGTAHIGDIGSRRPELVAEAALLQAGGPGAAYPVTHFLEVFGHALPGGMSPAAPPELNVCKLTPACAASLPQERHGNCAAAGHALYSTEPEAMRAAREWCAARGRPFSLHLAESVEEEDCLLHGRGDLHDLLRLRVLPKDWRAPGIRPVPYAARIGLLGPGVLAVHAVHCDADDIVLIAGAGASVCLCPRSNAFINVGQAPAKAMAGAGIALCLGTDSLASNHSLDMFEEMRAARETYGFSSRAVLRMATLNGAHALGLAHLGSLAPGKAARFAVLPGDRA